MHMPEPNHFTDIFTEGEIEKVFSQSELAVVHKSTIDGKEAQYTPWSDMPLSENSKKFWQRTGYDTMWSHQRKAIETALAGKNLCVSTSTSSGKTEIFQTIAIEAISRSIRRNPKVLAVYSAKALNRQQKERWERTGYTIGQIDGSDTNRQHRMDKLTNCDVIVITPDVLHTFILGNLRHETDGKTIQQFIKNIELIIIDEIHLYRGVFGTNSAYLFRRLNNVRRLLRNDLSFPLYVTASATLPNPDEHSSAITGASPFVNIGIEEDGSPSAQTDFYFIEAKNATDNSTVDSTHITNLITSLAKYNNARTITFVEGRQQTGRIVLGSETDHFFKDKLKIYPFRAGIEEQAREQILQAMENNDFNGIVSTSALEIGISISGLNIAVIANMPYDMNSFMQRIGRVGRGSSKNKSIVIIANDGSINARLLFNEKNFDVSKVLPNIEPALHLTNENVMYAHAACHIDEGKNCELTSKQTQEPNFDKYFIPEFVKLCQDIITNNRTTAYDSFVNQIDNPHYQFSLRSIGDIYQIYLEDNKIEGDTITRIQLFREAYNGASRTTHTYENEQVKNVLTRICDIQKTDKIIKSKKERNSHRRTTPWSKTFVLPNFSKDQRHFTLKSDQTSIYSLRVYERRVAFGYYELFGKKKTYKKYDRPFSDQKFSTGVVIFHPSFNNKNVNVYQIARMIFEAFLLQRAFDRSDINYEAARMYKPNDAEGILANDRFVAIYDLNQLDITHKLLDSDILQNTFKLINDNLDDFGLVFFDKPISEDTKNSIKELCSDILSGALEKVDAKDSSGMVSVIKDGEPAKYIPEDTSDPETLPMEPIDVIIVAHYIQDDGAITYNILIPPTRLEFGINEAYIIATPKTQFEHIKSPAIL